MQWPMPLAWLRSTVRRLQLQRRLAACAAAAKGAPPPVMPHVVAGLPVLGSALALGSGGADFLRQFREKVGGLCTAGSTACCHALTSKTLAAASAALACLAPPLTHAAHSRCSLALLCPPPHPTAAARRRLHAAPAGPAHDIRVCAGGAAALLHCARHAADLCAGGPAGRSTKSPLIRSSVPATAGRRSCLSY